MRIDRQHRGWFICSIVGLAAATALYVWYVREYRDRVKGDTWPGLAYGVVATGMILLAGTLGARKKVLLLRIGNLTLWLRMHLWLGMLAVPMVLFHGAFSFGGLLTTILMLLLILITVTGVIGVAFQHAMPGVMMAQVEAETTFEQMARMLGNLRREAYELVWAACGVPPQTGATPIEWQEIQRGCGKGPDKPKGRDLIPAVSLSGAPVLGRGQTRIEALYHAAVLPALCADAACGADGRGRQMLESAATDLHPALEPAMKGLREVYEKGQAVRGETGLDAAQRDKKLAELRREAYGLVWSACGAAPETDDEWMEIRADTESTPAKPDKVAALGSAVGQDKLMSFYLETLRPYLRAPDRRGHRLRREVDAHRVFDLVRLDVQPTLHETVAALEEICGEIRQKMRQVRLHYWLHAWLLIHVPLSMAMLVLIPVHAVMALYY
jgi:hypothetical protein